MVEALTIKNHLDLSTVEDATKAIRRYLIAERGLRQFLAERLNSHAATPAGGWTVEFDYGRRQIQLHDQGKTLLDMLDALLEENYVQRGVWPTGVRKGELYIAL